MGKTMIKQSNATELDIPAFLKRDKATNELLVKGKKIKATVKHFEIATPIDPVDELSLSPETASLLKAEIKTRRFQPHWLADADTIFVFEREHQLRKAKREAKAEDREVERKIKRNERLAAKAALPEFGVDLKIIVINRNPKRQAGAARIPRFASLLDYLDKNPNASVAEVLKNTTYIKSDFLRDVRLKIIKTDIISKKKGK
jgi:uncharacterized membrane protein